MKKLTALRAEMKRQQLDAFIVPMADEYQNEYVPPAARRIEFLTGFTGSAGVAVVLVEKAAFFTDSRYTLQAAAEVPAALYEQHDTATMLPRVWLAAALPDGGRVGYDPWLHCVQGIEQLRTALPKLVLVPVMPNLVDAIWRERPAASFSAVQAYPLDFAGQSNAEKRALLAEPLAQNQVAAVVLTDPASTAWLLNMRGADVPYTPLPLGFAILHQDASVQWFIDPSRLDQTAQDALDKDVVCLPPDEFLPMLDRLGATQKKVQLDPALCAAIIAEHLTNAGAQIIHADDPCALPRALKNPVEQAGIARAHQRDGVALAEGEGVLPGGHAFFEHAVFDDAHVVGEGRPVNPVGVGEVGADEAGAAGEVTAGAVRLIQRSAFGEHGGFRRGPGQVEVGEGLRLTGGLGGFGLGDGVAVEANLPLAEAEDVEPHQVEKGDDDGDDEEPDPPAGELVVLFLNAVVVVAGHGMMVGHVSVLRYRGLKFRRRAGAWRPCARLRLCGPPARAGKR